MIFLAPRWRKVIRDIWGNKSRTILVVLAIAVGVFAFGSMFITRSVLLANMNNGFEQTNPATITLNTSPFDDSLVHTARSFPYVRDVSAKATSQVQVYTGTNWTLIDLNSTPDFRKMEISRIALEQGTMEPGRHEILLERQSLTQLNGAGLGDRLLIELPDGSQKELTIVGVVHDFYAIPASRIPLLTGYVSIDTLNEFGLSSEYNQLQIVTIPSLQTQQQLEAASDEIADLLDRYGYAVEGVTLNEPGKHWASDFIEAVVLVLIVLGSLALALSGLLVVNTITAILGAQQRQIGMMKAVGARTGDVIGVYMATSIVYGVAALLIALPVGSVLANAMSRTLADFLNVNITDFHAPLWIYALELATALVVPLMAAFVPTLMGAQTTVREAISDYGIGTIGTAQGWLDRFVMSVRGLSRPVLLSLRNTFRRKGRLSLTLVTLAMAGAIFIAVLNTRVSVLKQFDQILAMFGYDVQVVLTEPQQVSRLEREAMRVQGVNHVEGWGFASATVIRPDGVTAPDVSIAQSGPTGGGGPPGGRHRGSDENAGTDLTIFAPPPDTDFVHPTMLEGRWLRSEDTNAIVLGSEVLNNEPYIHVGDEIKLDFGDVERTLEVVGIVNLIGPDFGYAPFDYITKLRGAGGQSRVAMLGTTSRDEDFQQAVSRDVEDWYQDTGIGVLQTATPATFIGVITSQVDFFVLFMIFMAILLGIVGGLGLASTMSLNVLERTREIGVMRAVGASDNAVRSIVLSEGLLIGAISYGIAVILSIPISYGFVIGVGYAFFDRPMDLSIAPVGFAGWLGIAFLLAAGASLLPAHRAASITVHEALAYE